MAAADVVAVEVEAEEEAETKEAEEAGTKDFVETIEGNVAARANNSTHVY